MKFQSLFLFLAATAAHANDVVPNFLRGRKLAGQNTAKLDPTCAAKCNVNNAPGLLASSCVGSSKETFPVCHTANGKNFVTLCVNLEAWAQENGHCLQHKDICGTCEEAKKSGLLPTGATSDATSTAASSSNPASLTTPATSTSSDSTTSAATTGASDSATASNGNGAGTSGSGSSTSGTTPATATTPGTTTSTDSSGTFSAQEASTGSGGGYGDPHLKTWRGRVYDFHGECDLVLVHSAAFDHGLGLDIHIRTEIRHDWSFIAGAAIKIGDDVLEVGAHGAYLLNGVESAPLSTVGPYSIKKVEKTDKLTKFIIDLAEHGSILIKAYEEFLAVSVKDATASFADSVGLMGSFAEGALVAREGHIVSDPVEFALQWQVRDETRLFQQAKGPQYPLACRMPEPKSTSRRRRLDEAEVTREEAEKACSDWGEDIETCIYDVLATNNLDMAQAGAF